MALTSLHWLLGTDDGCTRLL